MRSPVRRLRKTVRRTATYLAAAIAWRDDERDQAPVVWLFIAGAVWAVSRHDAAVLGVAALLVPVLLGICAVDSRYGIIPDALVLALTAIGGLDLLVVAPAGDWIVRLAACGLVYGGGLTIHALYRAFRSHDGFGLGDVKFAAAACLWTGASGLPFLIALAVASALTSVAILRVHHELSRTTAVPFGPHLAVALWIVWLLAPQDWLLALA